MNDRERYENLETIHMYIAIKRKKDNVQERKIVFKQLIYDPMLDLSIIKEKCKSIPGTWRIYRTVNKRNIRKAMKLLQHELIDTEKTSVESMWRRCLLQPACKAEKKRLIDIDDKELTIPVRNILDKNNVKIIEFAETPGGFHFVTEVFDSRLLEEYTKTKKVEIYNDRYIFVDKIEV